MNWSFKSSSAPVFTGAAPSKEHPLEYCLVQIAWVVLATGSRCFLIVARKRKDDHFGYLSGIGKQLEVRYFLGTQVRKSIRSGQG